MYRPEVFPVRFITSLPGHIPEKGHWKKSSTHLNPKGSTWKRREAESMKKTKYDKTSVKPGNLDVKFLYEGPNWMISSACFPELNKPCMIIFSYVDKCNSIAYCWLGWDMVLNSFVLVNFEIGRLDNWKHKNFSFHIFLCIRFDPKELLLHMFKESWVNTDKGKYK